MSAVAAGWQAEIALRFVRRGARTVMTENRHRGPLQVQKALYPEGAAICQVAVLHPPGGIAAGDTLEMAAHVGDGAQVLLTTPGATKWYRSDGAWSGQTIRWQVGEGAVLEWLPRENIFFDGSRGAAMLDLDLAQDAQYVGWDIHCFGRRASGESWRRGALRLRTRITRERQVLWSEVADVSATGGFARSAVGLDGFSVCGTFIAAGRDIDASLLAACRAVPVPPGRARFGVTRLPAVLVGRYLGDSSEAAAGWFMRLWDASRHALRGTAAVAPRCWAC